MRPQTPPYRGPRPRRVRSGRRPPRGMLLVYIVFALAVPCHPAAGQSTRAEVVREAQAEKARALEPPRRNGVERTIEHLEEWGLIAGEPRGFYPWLGSVYPGGGFAGGLGYRKPFGDDGAVNVFGGYSVGTFSRAQVDVALPTFAAHRARLSLSGRYIDAPDVRYFGTGNGSSRTDQTRFGYTPVAGGARLDITPTKYFTLGGGADYLSIDTSSGRTAPSIEERFSPFDTPGLGVGEFTYVNSTAYAAFDWRKTPGYSGRGGLYRVQFDDFREQDREGFSFRSLEAEVRQLVPILGANWVISLRGLATVTDLDDTSVVPFFMLPSLGGGSSLRGFGSWRFRDRHSLLLQAEWRVLANRFLDMALFYDAGKVAARRADLDFTGLKNDFGIGFRFHSLTATPLRIELAKSNEGLSAR